MPRFLQTADWHLGATTEGVSREEDHSRFLAWLARTLAEREVDALLVSGDVFDQTQPSAEALRLYFGFLSDVACGGRRTVVVVGGNHDSPSRLDAPRDVLAALDVHVVGGLAADESTWERCLHPIEGRDGSRAIVLAVPFVHECRLGVRTSLASAEEIARSFRERFAALYAHLADLARARFPGVPLVATGHLTCEGAGPGDAPAAIHQVGTIGGLPAGVFDPRIQHVALGHIHRMLRPGNGRAWYSGSPVPLTPREAASPRHVLLVETSPEPDGEARVTPVEVPADRAILEISGTFEEVARRLAESRFPGDLPALVHASLRVPRFTPGLEEELRRLVESHPSSPRLVRVRQELDRLPGDTAPAPARVRLADVTPEEVFLRLCRDRGEPPDEELLVAFRSLLGPAPEPSP